VNWTAAAVGESKRLHSCSVRAGTHQQLRQRASVGEILEFFPPAVDGAASLADAIMNIAPWSVAAREADVLLRAVWGQERARRVIWFFSDGDDAFARRIAAALRDLFESKPVPLGSLYCYDDNVQGIARRTGTAIAVTPTRRRSRKLSPGVTWCRVAADFRRLSRVVESREQTPDRARRHKHRYAFDTRIPARSQLAHSRPRPRQRERLLPLLPFSATPWLAPFGTILTPQAPLPETAARSPRLKRSILVGGRRPAWKRHLPFALRPLSRPAPPRPPW
jgi:hypothetical protein